MSPRPSHRPRRDPDAARVGWSVYTHPETRARIVAEAARRGESAGQVVDRLAKRLETGKPVSGQKKSKPCQKGTP